MRRRTLTTKIRISYLVYDLGPGGLQNFVFNLANRLDSNLFECTIIGFSQKYRIEREKLTEGVKILAFNKQKGNDLGLIYQLYRLLRQERPHCVQSHNWGTLFEGLVSAKLARVPAFIHAERGTIERRRRNLILQWLLWRRVDQVLCVSELHRQRLSEAVGFSRDRIRPIANGVDTDTFRPCPNGKETIRSMLGLKPEQFYIGTVGNLRPVKNQVLMLRACRKLCQNYENVRVIIAGTGPLQDELSHYTKELGIQHKVQFLGARTDIPDVLNAMDVFVLPSLSEGMPNAVLEAMACGLPVVATRVGGLPEVVEDGETGILTPSQDEAFLESALFNLLHDDTKRQMLGEKGRKRVLEHFSLDKMVEEYQNLYHALVEGRCL